MQINLEKLREKCTGLTIGEFPVRNVLDEKFKKFNIKFFGENSDSLITSNQKISEEYSFFLYDIRSKAIIIAFENDSLIKDHILFNFIFEKYKSKRIHSIQISGYSELYVLRSDLSRSLMHDFLSILKDFERSLSDTYPIKCEIYFSVDFIKSEIDDIIEI